MPACEFGAWPESCYHLEAIYITPSGDGFEETINMKKRKPPILLGTVLLILLGAIVVWNMPKPDPTQNQGAPAPDATPRADQSTSDVVNNTKNAISSPKPQNTAVPT